MNIDRPIAIAIILFVILLLAFFLVVPEYKTFASLRTELGEKRAEFNAEFDYYAAITRLHYDLQSRQDDIKKIDDALPSDPDLGRIVYSLQRMAGESGLVVKNLFLSKSSSAKTKKDGVESIRELIFSIDLVGSYPALGNFIASIEKSSRIFEVINISFGSGGTVSSQSSQTQVRSAGLGSVLRPQQSYNFNLQIKTHSY